MGMGSGVVVAAAASDGARRPAVLDGERCAGGMRGLREGFLFPRRGPPVGAKSWSSDDVPCWVCRGLISRAAGRAARSTARWSGLRIAVAAENGTPSFF